MTYEQLAARFDRHTDDGQGHISITGEQVVTRLNEVLGFDGWSFAVREHGIDKESDTAWVLGRLEIYSDGKTIIREQFGSQQLKRFSKGPNQGKVIDLANDQMGAATGALKKCASLIGVGLYLRVKGNSTGASLGNQGNQSRQGQQNSSGQRAASATGAPMLCADCNSPLEPFPVRYQPSEQFPNGREVTWSVQDLANQSRKKHGRVLCGEHYFNPSP